jgi:sarcosine oxidase
MPQATYDVVVLGAGGVGSAAMWQLAKRGLSVLGIDRFHPPHDRGSSHGQSRIIRQAYFEHANYVPLLLAGYELWEQLEAISGQPLKHEVGLLEVGPANGTVVPGVLEAAQQHDLKVEHLSAAEVIKRWPAFRVPDELTAVFEPRAGWLHVEECVSACLEAARRHGATLLPGVEVSDWSAGDDIVLHTANGDITAARLVVTAGAWAGQLLKSLNVPLRVRRKTLMWFSSSDARTQAAAGFPCYLFELPEGVFYGFPEVDARGLKAAEHSGGEWIVDSLNVDRNLRESDRKPVEHFLLSHLPAAQLPHREHAVCLYTMSPDEQFIVDRHPNDSRIVFAAGLSGHGFKFTPVLGQILADLVVEGQTQLPADFLSLRRFAGTI